MLIRIFSAVAIAIPLLGCVYSLTQKNGLDGAVSFFFWLSLLLILAFPVANSLLIFKLHLPAWFAVLTFIISTFAAYALVAPDFSQGYVFRGAILGGLYTIVFIAAFLCPTSTDLSKNILWCSIVLIFPLVIAGSSLRQGLSELKGLRLWLMHGVISIFEPGSNRYGLSQEARDKMFLHMQGEAYSIESNKAELDQKTASIKAMFSEIFSHGESLGDIELSIKQCWADKARCSRTGNSLVCFILRKVDDSNQLGWSVKFTKNPQLSIEVQWERKGIKGA